MATAVSTFPGLSDVLTILNVLALSIVPSPSRTLTLSKGPAISKAPAISDVQAISEVQALSVVLPLLSEV